MSGPIIVRSYAEADYAHVRKNLEQAKMFDPICDARENISLAAQPPSAVLVAEMNGTVVGSLMLTPLGTHVFVIWRFVVAERHRTQGIGQKLLTAAEQAARDHGAKETWLFADVTNSDLVAYYQKRGYQHNPDHHYFGMWKPLG